MTVFFGIDVAKERLDCAVVVHDRQRPIGQQSFSHTPDGIERAAAWAMKASKSDHFEIHAILEPTAAYHALAARLLAAKGMTVSLVNPAQIRSFAKGMAVLSKTDEINAVLLARYGCLARPKAWTPPAKPLTELQALLARLDDLEGDLRREQNRYEQARVRGCSSAIKHSFAASIRALKAQCKLLQKAIAEHFAAHEDLQADLKRLRTIPAVGPKTAMRMLALLRSHSFETARQVAAFLGLVPIERQSGRSAQGRPRLSKAGNSRLHAALDMAAVVATKLNPDIKAQHQRLLERGKAKMSTLGPPCASWFTSALVSSKAGAITAVRLPTRLDRADGIYIKVRGRRMYLYRAIDSNGDTVEFWFSERRNLTAAKRFLRKALQRHGRPERIVIDGSQTNREAILCCDTADQLQDRSRRRMKPIRIRQSAYLNNRIEQDHR
ncbi:IS110 family transposase, partial [Microvirga sp. KLBC 81]